MMDNETTPSFHHSISYPSVVFIHHIRFTVKETLVRGSKPGVHGPLKYLWRGSWGSMEIIKVM